MSSMYWGYCSQSICGKVVCNYSLKYLFLERKFFKRCHFLFYNIRLSHRIGICSCGFRGSDLCIQICKIYKEEKGSWWDNYAWKYHRSIYEPFILKVGQVHFFCDYKLFTNKKNIFCTYLSLSSFFSKMNLPHFQNKWFVYKQNSISKFEFQEIFDNIVFSN